MQGVDQDCVLILVNARIMVYGKQRWWARTRAGAWRRHGTFSAPSGGWWRDGYGASHALVEKPW